MNEQLPLMVPVYSYLYPEVWQAMNIVDGVFSKPEARAFFKTLTTVEQARDIIRPIGFQPELDIPSTASGRIDLDRIHLPVLERIVAAHSDIVVGLADFDYRYPTQGSSEGIFHVLSMLRAQDVDTVNVPVGEYEGYQEYGKTIGLKTEKHDLEEVKPSSVKPGVWFISNPSARDGNIIDNDVITALCDAGHRVYLDLAYVGSTKEHIFDASHPNISGVFMSASKPYGQFRFRIGETYSREPIDSLVANKWFKRDVGLLERLYVIETVGPHRLHPFYKSMQAAIVKGINDDYGLNLHPSDALLIASLNPEDVVGYDDRQKRLVAPFKRGNGYRFCLTPEYELFEERHR